MASKINDFLLRLNNKGIPLPLLRDNDKKKGSITYTLFVLSALIVAAAFIFDIGLYACYALSYCANEPTYYPKSELLMWFGTAGGLYFGRKTFPTQQENTKEEDEGNT
jgi:hypothetical protein